MSGAGPQPQERPQSWWYWKRGGEGYRHVRCSSTAWVSSARTTRSSDSTTVVWASPSTHRTSPTPPADSTWTRPPAPSSDASTSGTPRACSDRSTCWADTEPHSTGR
eukprot:EG_transcript_48642